MQTLEKDINEKSGLRNSNFEFLRILSMVMIVAHHYIVHGNFNWESVPFSLQKALALFLGGGGKLGVAIFVLISGYFGCKSKLKLKHIVSLLIKTWFFSVTIFVVFNCRVLPVLSASKQRKKTYRFINVLGNNDFNIYNIY